MLGIDDLYTEEYSERSFVMRGNTRAYKEQLKELGGKYNSRLRDTDSEDGVSPGWIFSKTKLQDVTDFLETGEVSSSKREVVKKIAPVKKVAAGKSSLKNESCPHCKKLETKVDELSEKMDRILEFFEKSENLKKNMMSGAGSMMKNMFGQMGSFSAHIFEEEAPTRINRMSPPSITLIEEDDEGPQSILDLS